MNAIPKIDMRDVLRLTRMGKLQEATALVQVGLAGRNGTQEARPEPRIRMLTESSPARRSAAPLPPEPFVSLHAKSLPRSPIDEVRGRALTPGGARFETRSIRNAAGALTFKLYVPAQGLRPCAPLVVMLHGCTQNADDFAAGTRMNELAEIYGFLVAYPEQSRAANSSRCWNWFKTADQMRDCGEPSLIADATRRIVAEFEIDAKHVFVAGLSAGGAAAAILGFTYPELYAGVGVHSGLACGAAFDMPSAFAAMRGGPRAVASAERYVPTIVFHGTRDATVSPLNAEAVSRQAVGRSAVDSTVERGRCADGTSYTRTAYQDRGGATIGETWLIDGAGHAWFGGSTFGSYTMSGGPDASREILRFFGIIASP
jgi:poly(hydroxyalkanoate) depolymerase family esterase